MIFFLAVAAVVAAVTGVIAAILVVQLNDFRSGSASGSDVSRTLEILDGAYGVGALLVIPTAIAFLAWLSRAVENAPPLGAGTPEASPAASIWWWFVPLANLVMPYRIVRDLLDRLAVPWLTPGPAGVLSWWLAFLFGNLLRSAATLATRLRTESLDQLVNTTTAAGVLAALGSAVLLSSALEAIRIVREVQKRSVSREAVLSGRSPGPWGPAAPGGWGGGAAWAPPPYGAAGAAPYAPPPGPVFVPPAVPPIAPPVAPAATQPGPTFAAFCPRCGARRLTPDRYCASCGFDLVLLGATAMPREDPSPGVGPPGRPAPEDTAPAGAPPEPPPPEPPVPEPPPEPPAGLSPADLAEWSSHRILELDALLDRLYEQGRSPRAADEELTEIGKRLHAAGGEPLMREALQGAQALGMRGRYVERHWTGIGSWMG